MSALSNLATPFWVGIAKFIFVLSGLNCPWRASSLNLPGGLYLSFNFDFYVSKIMHL